MKLDVAAICGYSNLSLTSHAILPSEGHFGEYVTCFFYMYEYIFTVKM